MRIEWTFYDRDGRAVAYADDGVHIHLFDGTAAGYVKGSSVYGYSGKHLGWFLRGWIRDHRGDGVLFADGKLGDGPVRPERWVKPMRGLKAERPPKGEAENRPGPPLTSRSWSETSVEAFFRGPAPEEEDEMEPSEGTREPFAE